MINCFFFLPLKADSKMSNLVAFMLFIFYFEQQSDTIMFPGES